MKNTKQHISLVIRKIIVMSGLFSIIVIVALIYIQVAIILIGQTPTLPQLIMAGILSLGGYFTTMYKISNWLEKEIEKLIIIKNT